MRHTSAFWLSVRQSGAAILAREGEPDPLCEDAGGRTRTEVHEELQALIVNYFDRVFGQGYDQSDEQRLWRYGISKRRHPKGCS